MLVNDGGIATQPRAPGHERPHAALCAARHGRLSAASTAPGADIPPDTTAGAPGQYCQSAALRAPGHGRPLAITAGGPCRDRQSAALLAPGAASPPATAAGAPSQHRPSAAHLAPGHERPRAARHGRPSAATRAPGADVPPATAAGAPGQHRLRAMANATVALPAGQYRLRQEGLPHTPANPRTLTHHTAASFPRQRKSGHGPTNAGGAQHVAPLPPPRRETARGLNGSPSQLAAGHRLAPSPGACSGGGLGRGLQDSHQAHPAIQVSPHPRPCSTAATGFPRNHLSRAPPRPAAVPPPQRGDDRGAGG